MILGEVKYDGNYHEWIVDRPDLGSIPSGGAILQAMPAGREGESTVAVQEAPQATPRIRRAVDIHQPNSRTVILIVNEGLIHVSQKIRKRSRIQRRKQKYWN